MLIRRGRHVAVTEGATGLHDVLHAGLSGSIEAVSEWHESIRAQGQTTESGQPGALFGGRYWLGSTGKERQQALPLRLGELVPTYELLDCVVSFVPPDFLLEMQLQGFRMHSKQPGIGLFTSKASATDA